MNEFIEQFLIESREQVEQATTDLLALEKAPGEAGPLDSAFRAFHTLKGGAGIVDFFAMGRAVHAAEDVLSAIRSGGRPITAQLIGDCLTCLDQVVQWLDAMENTGELPTDAEAGAEAVVARFARSRGEAAAAAQPAPVPQSATVQWAEDLLARHAPLRAQARIAVRYTPRPQCFYDGVDPLALVAALPGLLVVETAPASPWPPLDTLDPFVCNLVLTALTSGSRPEAMAVMADAATECDVVELAAQASSPSPALPPSPVLPPDLPPQAREVLEAQLALLGELAGRSAAAGAQAAAGIIASAALVAENVLRHAGRTAAAEHVARAMKSNWNAGDARAARNAIEAAWRAAPVVTTPGVSRPAALARAAAAPAGSTETEAAVSTLRVDAARIDALVKLAGELTVAKNAVGHAARLAEDGGNLLAPLLRERHAVLDRLVTELQQSVLGLRVLRLQHAFGRFPRLLREISAGLGKPVDLVIEGEETEADKVIVERLFEPLLHVVRNAVGHGIEDPSTRAAQGKPPTATLRLRATRHGAHVVVEVSDDGRGIDVARVRQVALERGLLDAASLSAMSDEEVIDLIFEPGFSTASAVTGLSGRGVGMDAVRSAVGRMAGRVEVESRAGKGTTVRFTLPFSIMMTRVMLVGAGEQTFGIPLDAVVETLRVGTDRILPVGAAHAIVLRDRTVPLLALGATLGLAEQRAEEGGEAIIVVISIDGCPSALRVDRIGERMEVVLQPLDGLLAGTRGLAGSTLLGDGSVLLILDLGELFR